MHANVFLMSPHSWLIVRLPQSFQDKHDTLQSGITTMVRLLAREMLLTYTASRVTLLTSTIPHDLCPRSLVNKYLHQKDDARGVTPDRSRRIRATSFIMYGSSTLGKAIQTGKEARTRVSDDSFSREVRRI